MKLKIKLSFHHLSKQRFQVAKFGQAPDVIEGSCVNVLCFLKSMVTVRTRPKEHNIYLTVSELIDKENCG